jgi:SRSO17 transposase
LELTCLVAIPADTRCWLQGPVTATRHPRYQDETRPLRTMVSIDSDPLSVEAIAQSLHDIFWYRRTVSTGIKGPMAYEFTKRRVTLCHNGRPDRTVWLVIKRTLGLEPLYWYYLSNAPLNTRLPTFVWLSGVRWAIEQCFEGAKTALGLHVGPFLSAAYD